MPKALLQLATLLRPALLLALVSLVSHTALAQGATYRVPNSGVDQSYSLSFVVYRSYNSSTSGPILKPNHVGNDFAQGFSFHCSEGYPSDASRWNTRWGNQHFTAVNIDTARFDAFQRLNQRSIQIDSVDYEKWIAAYNKACTTVIPLDQSVGQLEAKIRKEYFERLEAEMNKMIEKFAQSPEVVQKIEEIVQSRVEQELLKVEGTQ